MRLKISLLIIIALGNFYYLKAQNPISFEMGVHFINYINMGKNVDEKLNYGANFLINYSLNDKLKIKTGCVLFTKNYEYFTNNTLEYELKSEKHSMFYVQYPLNVSYSVTKIKNIQVSSLFGVNWFGCYKNSIIFEYNNENKINRVFDNTWLGLNSILGLEFDKNLSEKNQIKIIPFCQYVLIQDHGYNTPKSLFYYSNDRLSWGIRLNYIFDI